MALRTPLVLGDQGLPQQLQAGDTLAGGSVAATSVDVDFGSSGSGARSKTFNVALTGAAIGAKVIASPSLDMPTGVSADEYECDPFVVAGRVVTTNFVQLVVASLGAPLSRQRRINIVLG